MGETFSHRSGFIPNGATGELLTPIEGGYSLTVRHDEKILPAAAVRAAIHEALSAYEEINGQASDEQRGEIEATVMQDLIAKALVHTTIVNAFYREKENYLVVATTNKDLAQLVVSLLVKCCGSVKTTTIHISGIKGGLTQRLGNHLDGIENAFEGFKLSNYCLLKHKTNKATFDLDNLDRARDGLEEALRGEMQVETMALEHGQMCFKITKDFHLRKIVFFGELTEDEQEARGELDGAMLWRVEASVQLLQLSAAINALCQLFGYKEPVNDAIGEAGEGTVALEPIAPVGTEEQQMKKLTDAAEFVRSQGRCSISALQRHFQWGYNEAARMVEGLEAAGIVERHADGTHTVTKETEAQ